MTGEDAKRGACLMLVASTGHSLAEFPESFSRLYSAVAALQPGPQIFLST